MTFTDSLFDIMFMFRLGGKAKDDNKCLYYKYDLPATESPQLLERSSLPPLPDACNERKFIRVVVISDTHERHDRIGNLPEGDVLIHCGDILMTNRIFSQEASVQKLIHFNQWLQSEAVPINEKVVIAGNHDYIIERLGSNETQRLLSAATYLENSGCALKCGARVWGSPRSSGRSGNSAFQSNAFNRATDEAVDNLLSSRSDCLIKRDVQTEAEASCSSADVRQDIDILITHGPNMELPGRLLGPEAMHLWGHAHGYYGVRPPGSKLWGASVKCLSINASIMNTKYEPHGAPIVIDLSIPMEQQ